MSEDAGGGDPNGAVMSDPVDVIIDKLLRYVCLICILLFPIRVL